MISTIPKSYFIVKRIFDVVISIISITLIIPIIILIGLIIKLESPGPVFFRQVRVGYKGKLVELYKFRTMYVDAEMCKSTYAAFYNLSSDPRITTFGRFLRKTSLDQLPMFFSVLKGDMSLIGPRPALPFEVEHYTDAEKARLDVLPGITGYAQVMSVISEKFDYKEMLELDVEYIAKASLSTDFKILWKTILLGISRQIRT